MQIWKSNLKMFSRINRNPKNTYQTGENEFTDLTSDEFAQRLGKIKSSPPVTNYERVNRVASTPPKWTRYHSKFIFLFLRQRF